MTISGIGTNLSPAVQSALNIRSQLDDLQRQLGTGVKADSFSGLGPQGGVTIGLNAQLAALSSYANTMATVGTRLTIAQTDLTQLSTIATTVQRSTVGTSFAIDSTGQTSAQQAAASQLDQMLSILNTPAGDRYIFSGTASTQPAVDTTDHILNGNGPAAGLKQVISERNQADLGANGLGRLVIPPAGPGAATIVGAGATLSPDKPANGVGTVPSLTNATTLASLGITTGDTISVSDGTSTSSHVVTNTDTVGSLIAALNAGPAAATVSLPTTGPNAGHLQVQGGNSTSTITLSDNNATPGTDIAQLGFSAGNTSFAPTNLLTQGLTGQTLTVTVGANPTQTIQFGTAVGQVATLAQLQTKLTTVLAGTATATVDQTSGNITLTAANTTDSITVGGTVSAAKFGIQALSAAPTTAVTVSQDVAGSPFGFKVASVNSSLTGATVSGPTGSLATVFVGFGATPPNNGDTIKLTLNLPDGSTQQVSLQATTTSPPGTGQFAIGTTPAATAANFQAALTTSVGTLAKTALSAASAMAAGGNFFASNPPLRVAGPPFATATALVAGTAANTVTWYTGENGSTPALSTATAQISPSLKVSYGMRANQQGISWLLQNVAVLAATTYQSTDPNASASYAALNQRVFGALSVPTGTQSVSDIEAGLAAAQTAMKSTSTQQAQTQNTLTDMLQQVQGINQNQVGAEILALQTTLQASLQITAKLSQISLINYLPAA
jgi:flagellar hook-associated protein 3 FlgL